MSSSHTCLHLAAARSQGASRKPAFSRSCCIRCTSICKFKFNRQMSSNVNDQAKVSQFAAFRDHGLGHVALYPRWPHVLIGTLFQPHHSDVFPTIKELSEIFWHTIRALAYDLNQLIHNFKSHAPLQRFAWCITGLVLRLLNPSLNCRLANNLIWKMWIRLSEMLIMLNNGFHKKGDDWGTYAGQINILRNTSWLHSHARKSQLSPRARFVGWLILACVYVCV